MKEGKKERKKEEMKERRKEERPIVGLECGPAQPSLFVFPSHCASFLVSRAVNYPCNANELCPVIKPDNLLIGFPDHNQCKYTSHPQ